MAKFFRNAFKLATTDLANQFALPVKSMAGYGLTKFSASKTFPLNKVVIDRLNISPGNKVLELGYGRGDGIGYCLEKFGGGEGLICGIERSGYMEEVARKRFILELTETNVVSLDRCVDLRNLPYPSDLFDSVFHVDVFYFIHHDRLPEICSELLRVLKPGGRVLCGMEFKRLENLTKWGILHRSQWDPMRYLSCLEPVGFKDVHLDYVDDPSGRQFQVISARKPDADEAYFDAEARMAELENRVKQEMLVAELKRSGRVPTKEDLEILRELDH